MCTLSGSKLVGVPQERGLVHRLENQLNSFLYDLLHWWSHSQRMFLFLTRFRDPYASARAELVFTPLQPGRNVLQFPEGDSIQGLFRDTWSHVSRVTLDQFIRKDLVVNICNQIDETEIHKVRIQCITLLKLY